MSRRWHIAPGIAALAIFTAAACSSGASGSTGGTANSGGTSTTPIASSPAVAKAKDEATACLHGTGLGGLLTSSGRSALVDCLKSIVPPAQQEAFKNCVTSAATSDQVWTSDGRSKFLNTSLPNCLNAA